MMVMVEVIDNLPIHNSWKNGIANGNIFYKLLINTVSKHGVSKKYEWGEVEIRS